MAHLRSGPDSIVFYRKLGFEVPNTFTLPDEREPTLGLARLRTGPRVFEGITWLRKLIQDLRTP